MGCHSPPLDISHRSTFQETNSSRPNCISFQDAGVSGQQNCRDGGQSIGSSNNSECIIHNTERENHEVHVRDVSPNWSKNINIREQRDGSKIKSENDVSNEMVSFNSCPNKDGIRDLSSTVGKLCRIQSLDCITWEENPKTPCNFVLPHNPVKRKESEISMSEVSMGSEYNGSGGSGKDRPIVVEKIKDELDRMFTALSVGFAIEDSPENLLSGIERIQDYGFDHIIIIGELPYGILFFDCYGRVFEWNSMIGGLYWHGDDIEAAKRKYVGPELWGVEFDGTVVAINENEKRERNIYNSVPIAKKVKKKKDKKKKKHN
ncbi:hypothetical protein GLOIN_2v1488187 [Rhizophagus clarus]|nr:hypothetical protein GLOIN_2v1488187 [Rhizophagus clarus]